MGNKPPKAICQKILGAFNDLPPGSTLTRDDLASRLHRSHTYISKATDHMQRSGELINTATHGLTARYMPVPALKPKNTRQAIEHMLLSMNDGAHITVDMAVASTSAAKSTVKNIMTRLTKAGHCINTSTANMPGRYRLTHAGRSAIKDRIAAETAEATKTDETADPAALPIVTPPRLWHHASTARATGADVSPWSGTPLRHGALDAAALPSRGINA